MKGLSVAEWTRKMKTVKKMCVVLAVSFFLKQLSASILCDIQKMLLSHVESQNQAYLMIACYCYFFLQQ